MAAVSELLQRNPAQAETLLAELATQNERTVAEIRRLVYQLRPPALDDLGLVGAVRDYASDFRRGARDGAWMQVEVHAPESMPPLPAAIEAAAYRIATEALTNVARHARAQRALVSFSLEPVDSPRTLVLDITDNGAGMDGARRAGVGLISMRERAEEVGGTLRIEAAPAGGTRVVAALPVVEAR
jgi:signal transduction histidine kinase